MAELGHQLPDVTLVPYAVISDKVRVESWWDKPRDHAAAVLGVSEVSSSPGSAWLGSRSLEADALHRRAVVPNVIIVRSILFNLLFYLNLGVLLLVALVTLVLPRRAVLGMASSGAASACGCCGSSAAPRSNFAASRSFRSGAADRRRQASVDLGDLRAAAAVRRLHLHRQARADVDSDLRLVHGKGRHDAGRSRRRLAGADRHDARAPATKSAAAASSSSFRRAHGARPAPSRATSSASPISTPRSACRACRSR